MATNQPVQPFGEVYDLGYKHYDGPRLGRAHAIRALTLYSIRRGLGIRKRWTSKIMPIILYVAAFTPALIISGVKAFVPEEVVDFTYHDLYTFIGTALLIFAAGLAPEMLSDDRRENVLPLYFSRAITRFDYLAAKIAAMGLLMSTIAFGPALLLFVANVLFADDPIVYFFDHVGDLGRIALCGLLISAYLSAIGLAIAAFVNRKGVASAIFIGGIFLLSGIANALYEALDEPLRDYVILFAPFELIRAFTAWLFSDDSGIPMGNLQGGVYVVGMLVVIAVAAGIMYRRYLAEE